MLNQPHQCPDWDFAFIRPGDPEMDCCCCEPASPGMRVYQSVAAAERAVGQQTSAMFDAWQRAVATAEAHREKVRAMGKFRS